MRFADVAAQVGLDWTHVSGASPRKYFPETMGGGGAFLDYDGDGDLDVYLVNGAWLDSSLATGPPPVNALFRNDSHRFVEVGARTGVAHPGCGMGVAAGDIDSDGDLDLCVTNYGPEALYRNDGGHFAEITRAAGTSDPLWSTGCAFADYDRDGDLDLYVANYVLYDLSMAQEETIPYVAGYQSYAGQAPRGYPHPANFSGAPDVLYRNDGGHFANVTRAAGMYDESGKGLGVAFGDCDEDGWPDLYVANDAVRNFLYRNQGNGTFVEQGALAGVAYGQDGQQEAGMGVDWGDYDGDGRLDLTVTNFQSEPNSLYHNEGHGSFSAETYSSGVGLVSTPFLGFGTHFLDYDNNGLLDLFVANGHVLDNVHLIDQSTTYAQRNLLFRNDGPGSYGKVRFAEVGESAGAGMLLEQVSRGSATGDWDDDGDLDILVVNLGQKVALLRNDGGNRNNWLAVKLVGRSGNGHGIGARLTAQAGGRRQVQELWGSRSYLSHSDLRVHFGLGSSERLERLEIRWPSGRLEHYADLEANRLITIVEGKGILPASN